MNESETGRERGENTERGKYGQDRDLLSEGQRSEDEVKEIKHTTHTTHTTYDTHNTYRHT